MKNIGKSIILASLFFVTLSACAADFTSSYTSIKETDCKTLASSEMESRQSCQKFADIEVMAVEYDLRQSLILRRGGKDYPLNFWSSVTQNHSILGPKIEWRHKKGKPTNIVGIITRLNVSENTLRPDKETSYLVVSKLTANEICVVGKIAPQADQNKKARSMAEKSASMSCIGSLGVDTPTKKKTTGNTQNKLELHEKMGLNGIGTKVPFVFKDIKKHLSGYDIMEASTECEAGECSIISIATPKGEYLASILNSGNGYDRILVTSKKVTPMVTGVIGNSLGSMYFSSDEKTYKEYCVAGMKDESGNILCYARTASRDKTKHIQHIYSGSYNGADGTLPPLKTARTFKITATLWSSHTQKTTSTKNTPLYFDVKTMKWRDAQGVCHTCTKANGFPIPVIRDGIYFDPMDKAWHGPDSADVCHTCTPENGFPANGNFRRY